MLYLDFCPKAVQFSSVQSLSCVQLFVTAAPWTAARQASLSITNSWCFLKLMSIESVMPSNHIILCYLLLLQPSTFPSISSVHFSCSVVSDSLQPHGLQHTRPPCPSPTPKAGSNSCSLSRYAIQPSQPLSFSFPPAFNLSHHQGLFK